MIITKTPFRLSLFGGGTDYPEWYRYNKSLVISAAINKYCYLSFRSLPPFFNHKSRAVYSHVESVLNNSDFEHPSLRACLKSFDINFGVEIHHDSDLPARTGIGSSSAFTVGLINALATYFGKKLSAIELAEKAINIEQNVLNEAVGVQDQITSAFGGMNVISLGSSGIDSVKKIEISAEAISSIEDSLLLGYTGRERMSSIYSTEIVKKITANNVEFQLKRISEASTLALNLLQGNFKLRELGELLDYTWNLKVQMSSDGIPLDIRNFYSRAIKLGAFGGKLMGAGGSGFMYFIAPKKMHEKIKNGLSEIKVWVPVKFSSEGSSVIYESNFG
jgi:D-glycero-alpha-D-manno-heptose-7-phosphate kinase